MSILLSLTALALAAAAAPAAPVPDAGLLQPYPGPSKEICRDRIQAVRDDRALPRLERRTASPDEPLFIAAVDKRVDGCSVMVMRNDTADLRPLPDADGPGRLLRAR